ncbi:hypothetical protein N865_12330 [Intrasporangium oryzae NRRL B-24470]|uniref:Uncharacterized protein n=1 Tax=Intrasporangium oryzae NRRL B-24470 TaxID=1386089 RepID=W9GAY9_9MICO|nr:hypothetical protein [Intrasporangium oryzae]EWT00999.1 hypothetical protein N865_12330 [Intrasporangium oryzae NRRL B-24470]
MNMHLPEASGTPREVDVGLLTEGDLLRLSEVEGPCVSVYLPTSVFGPDTRQGPARLRTLLRDVVQRLEDAGLEDRAIGDLLGPIRVLENDPSFWQHQGPGLALFAAPGFSAGFRLPVAIDDRVAVGAAFRLRPLLPLLAPDGAFFVLALAQNGVRLFHGTRDGMDELDLGAIPASMEAAIPQEEMERHGQSHSVGRQNGRGEAQFHGQGNEADYDKAALARWFRAVDDPLVDRLGGRSEPLVLACVGYYLPVYRAASRYPAVWDQAIEGNPEHRTPQELHDAAWALLADHFAEREEHLRDRYREVAGTGRTLSDPGLILTAAREGRVDTLFLDPEAATDSGDALDAALAETVRHRGRVVPFGVPSGPDGPAAVLLRY